jgi:hypothetical protein
VCRFAQQACTLAISDILKAILKDFAARDVKIPEQDADRRLAQVLVDQLQQAPVHECYLPYASSAGLLGILEALQAEPGITGRWRIGPRRFMSANARWRGSSFVSWA